MSDERITRLEVIDETGRVLTRRPCKVALSYQDDGRTLKVFVSGGRPYISESPYDLSVGRKGFRK